MTPIKWFRKNTKKLLVGFGTVLMLAFLIPMSVTDGCFKRSVTSNTYGYVTDLSGDKVDVTINDIKMKDIYLSAMRELNIDTISQVLGMPAITSQFPDLGGIDQFTLIATRMLFFNDMRTAVQMRSALRQQASTWADGDQDVFDQLIKDIDALASSDNNQAPLNFYLLSEEAKKNGIVSSMQQVEEILAIRADLVSKGQLPNVTVKQVIDAHKITESTLKQAIGEYLAILRYANIATQPASISEPELRKAVRDQYQIEHVDGTFVSFDTRLFDKKVAEPTEEQLTAFFEKYKSEDPTDLSEDNKFGFSYLLPDRIQVEYLKVDIAKVKEKVQDEFNQIDPLEQEKTLQEFWSANQMNYRVQIPESQRDADNPDAPTFRDPAFDEVARQVKDDYLQSKAEDKVEILLADAKRLSDAAEGTSDYAAIAQNVSTDDIPVQAGKTNFFSMIQPDPAIPFNTTYMMRKRAAQNPSLGILFNCKPLRKTDVTRLDIPPIAINEDVTSLSTLDYSQKATASYMMRVVAYDKQREATSLDDDGRQGSADNSPLANSTLRETVTEDWKTVQAYELAKAQAESFAASAKTDWQAALDQANIDLKDPCSAESFKPLREDKLESIRDRAERMMEMMQNNPNAQQYFMSQVRESQMLLQGAMKKAQEIKATDPQLTVLDHEAGLSCKVFQDLAAPMPNQDEYLERKPLVAEQLLKSNQALFMIKHFSPLGIEMRSGYEPFKHEDDEADAPEEESAEN